jgi:dTDP-4-amino-4,6-dideoxygalactose transaminase
LNTIPVFKPQLPLAEKLLPYIQSIDTTNIYTNIGPLCKSFETRLAQHFGVQDGEVITCANGTLALTQGLLALGARPGGVCVMPSWTFVATPAAARFANLEPYFIDVHLNSWAIHPEDIYPLLKTQNISAVIPVAPYGKPLNCAEWEDFHKKTGIPVLIDAAAAFDSFSINQMPNTTTIPFMVSLHATKVLGVGEGAVLVTKNNDLSRLVRQLGNFGFFESRYAEVVGINSKLSEYSAAVGLAALDDWKEIRNQWQKLSSHFYELASNTPSVTTMPDFNQGWISCYGLIEFEKPVLNYVRKRLGEMGIEERSWWGNGCHSQTAYSLCPRHNLPNTEILVNRVLGLPFWIGLSIGDMKYIFECLRKILLEIKNI